MKIQPEFLHSQTERKSKRQFSLSINSRAQMSGIVIGGTWVEQFLNLGGAGWCTLALEDRMGAEKLVESPTRTSNSVCLSLRGPGETSWWRKISEFRSSLGVN